MIEREIAPRLKRLFGQYPFVTVTGPRQSGKTTLCRETFPGLAYVNLEAPDHREFAESDPRGFLARLGEGAILDEIQRVPNLLSYLQVVADEKGRNGLFVLTGSEHFKLSEAIGQSLAGRTGLLRLLPFTLGEREQTGVSGTLDEVLYSGFYPRIFDQNIEPRQALGDYFETYVERDVRRLGDIRNVANFRRFVRLCAGRVGQLVNSASLGSDAGVSHTTVRNWLDLLERSYIAFRLPPFHANLRKRLVKTPKLFFYDVGLAAYLIGIERADQIPSHPLRGPLFENMVVVEVLKHRFNRGRSSNLSFFRDSRGLECDLLLKTAPGFGAIEIKSGATVASDFFASLDSVAKAVPDVTLKAVVYGGAERQSRSAGEVVPFDDLHGFLDRFEADREMTVFVKDRLAPSPAQGDMDTVDNIYRRHIRPTIDALDGSLKNRLASLFSSFGWSDFVKPNSEGGVSGSVLDTGSWERTKIEYVAKPGFSLSDERPLTIGKEYRFDNYGGARNRDFGIVVSLAWTLESEGFSRNATINKVMLAKLNSRVQYVDIDTRSARIDSTVSAIENGIRDAIEKLSGTR